MRRYTLPAIVLSLAALMAGCGIPVPADKSAYVGTWRSPTMYLSIAQDGSVRYKRQKAGVSTSVNGPLKAFDGDSFSVGIGALSTTFNVSQPPHDQDGAWKMTVDGVELTRTSTQPMPGE